MTAINPKDYLQAAFNGEGEVGTSLFSKNSECYDPATAQLMPTPGVANAKSILLSDGYVAGSDGTLSKDGAALNITVIGTSALQGQGTEYISAQLTSLGMRVSTSDTDVNTWFSKVLAGKFDVFVAGFSKAVPAASVNITFWSGPLPPNGSNFSWIVDPTTEADIAAALPLIGSARCPAWFKYQEDVLKDYDMLPLVAQTTNYFSRKGITFVPSVAFAETETIRPTS